MLKKLSKDQFKKIINKLQQEFLVMAPFKVEQGKTTQILYKPVESAEMIKSIYLKEQPDVSLKEYYLPQDQKLGDEINGANEEAADWSKKPRLFLGVRSCDLEGIKLLDDVFIENDFVDPFYKNRRENSILIGYSCKKPSKSSFCKQLGIDPMENEIAPFYLYKSDNIFYLSTNEELLNKLSKKITDLIEDLPEIDNGKLEKLKEKYRHNFNEKDFSLNHELPYPEKEIFTEVNWEQATASCLGCGVCTFYCPTCFCFKFFWENTKKNRTWDSCMFSIFTEHASGHNPRQNQEQRWRQRLMHKFSYHPTNFEGNPGCVGCGRCLNKCPVNLDIRNVLNRVEEPLDKGGENNEGG